jgi:hypothetical protein
MLPATADRVPAHTGEHINSLIRQQTVANVATHAADGASIERRLPELDHEWDIERTLEANAATVALLGLGLGVFVDRRFLILPAAVAGFLLQHALQGWCPPVPVFRRLGFRTEAEIARERYALKAVRGDFAAIGRASNPGAAEEAVNAASR